MSRRERTASPNSPAAAARRGDDWDVVFVPDRIELELVGILAPGDGAGDEPMESVLLEGEEGLLDLVESLSYGADPQLGSCADAGCAAGDRPVN